MLLNISECLHINNTDTNKERTISHLDVFRVNDIYPKLFYEEISKGQKSDPCHHDRKN